MTKKKKIHIACRNGMVGYAVETALQAEGYSNMAGKTSMQLNLLNQVQINKFIVIEKPSAIIDVAAWVGVILANGE